ncbi:beta-class carbonic anhydrase [Ferrimicrobium acidiphilum]|uniref:beta-class carbonic anhydrase n=1 Tax=Ferrimicrobium acidiphilum TaxID=121039 RepID=UPI0023F0A6EF|nr:carbonic anhydrase [Ferrimicrobium acidiphilum]
MTVTEELLQNAKSYSATFTKGDLAMPPARHVAIVVCMDARLNPYGIFGLTEGDAHVIRNAGGVVTDDVIRSLTISQRLLGTEEIILVHHFDCGMRTFQDDEFLNQITSDTGVRPAWIPRSFTDSVANVRDSITRLQNTPFLPIRSAIRGFVYQDKTGQLQEVTTD